MQAQVIDYQKKLEDASERFFGLKKEVEDSPLSVLRNELGQKQLEIVELETKVRQALEGREEFKAKYDQVKKDMITLKRQIDNEKEAALTKQATELQELKTMMKNKQAQEEERKQFDELKTQLMTLQGRLTDHAQIEQEEAARQSRKPFGQSSKGAMMAPDRQVYFDDFARKQPSPTHQSERTRSMLSS